VDLPTNHAQAIVEVLTTTEIASSTSTNEDDGSWAGTNFLGSMTQVSWNRPNYKSTSPKTIAKTIKFSNLSPYNSGSP
jgi:hypothetical protein